MPACFFFEAAFEIESFIDIFKMLTSKLSNVDHFFARLNKKPRIPGCAPLLIHL